MCNSAVGVVHTICIHPATGDFLHILKYMLLYLITGWALTLAHETWFEAKFRQFEYSVGDV